MQCSNHDCGVYRQIPTCRCTILSSFNPNKNYRHKRLEKYMGPVTADFHYDSANMGYPGEASILNFDVYKNVKKKLGPCPG
jgi:hypothetical protein